MRAHTKTLVPILAVTAAVVAGVRAPAPVAAQEVRVTEIRSSNGWIGFSYETRPVEGSGEPGVRLVITDVYQGSPADQAGFRPGDQIVRVEGEEATAERIALMSSRLQPGDTVTLTLAREGWTQQMSVEAASRPGRSFVMLPRDLVVRMDSTIQRLDSLRVRVLNGQAAIAGRHRSTDSGVVVVSPDTRALVRPGGAATMRFRFSEGEAGDSSPDSGSWSLRMLLGTEEGEAGPDRKSTVSLSGPLMPYIIGQRRVAGAELVALNSELASYFDVTGGLLVTEVTDGTPADEGGLVPGDVVVEVGEVEVSSLEELRRAFYGYRGGREIPLTLVRKGERVELRLPR